MNTNEIQNRSFYRDCGNSSSGCILMVTAMFECYLEKHGFAEGDRKLLSEAKRLCLDRAHLDDYLDVLDVLRDREITGEMAFAEALKYRYRSLQDECTPQDMCELAVRLLDIQPKEDVFDGCCGYGAFLRKASQKLSERGRLMGQEVSPGVCASAKMIMRMSAIPAGIAEMNTLDFRTPEFDKGFVEPPVGQLKEDDCTMGREKLFRDAEMTTWLFVHRCLSGMRRHGRLAAFVPMSSLFLRQDDAYRRYLVENNLIEGIIGFSEGRMRNPYVQSAMVVLTRDRQTADVKMVDGDRYIHDGCLNLDELMQDYEDKEHGMYSREDIAHYEYELIPKNYLYLNGALVDPEADQLDSISVYSWSPRGGTVTLGQEEEETVPGFGYRTLTDHELTFHHTMEHKGFIPIPADEVLDEFVTEAGDIVIWVKGKLKLGYVDMQFDDYTAACHGLLLIRPDMTKVTQLFLQRFMESDNAEDLAWSLMADIRAERKEANRQRKNALRAPKKHTDYVVHYEYMRGKKKKK